MVLGTARTAEPYRRDDDLTAPTFRSVLLGGLPAFLREGFLPLGAFYVGWRTAGLGVGIGASFLSSLFIYLLERRAGRDGLVVRLSLGFVVIQSAVGLISNDAIVYLATPVVANLLWALAFLVSPAIGRPLAGALACAWYPFSDELRATETFKRVFGFESVVWGVYLPRPRRASSEHSADRAHRRVCRRQLRHRDAADARAHGVVDPLLDQPVREGRRLKRRVRIL